MHSFAGVPEDICYVAAGSVIKAEVNLNLNVATFGNFSGWMERGSSSDGWWESRYQMLALTNTRVFHSVQLEVQWSLEMSWKIVPD